MTQQTNDQAAEVIPAIDDAAASADRLEDPYRYVTAALAITPGGSLSIEADPERLAVITRAAELVGDDNLEHRVMLLAAFASETDLASAKEPRELAAQALDLARSSGDDQLVLSVLAATFFVDAGPTAHERWLGDTEWAMTAAANQDDRSLEFWITIARIRVLGEAGRTDDYEAAIAHATQLIGDTGTPRLFNALRHPTTASMAQRAELVDASYARERGLPNALIRYASQLFVIRLLQGRLDELVDLFVDATERTSGVATMQAATAYMLCDLGRFDEARVAFPFTRESIEGFPDDFAWTVGVKCVAHCIAALGEADLAEVLYDKMFPHRHLFANSFFAALQCAETHGFAGLERRINTMSR